MMHVKPALIIIAVSATLFTAGRAADGGSARVNEEVQLIQILQSDATPEEKSAACVRLHRAGTDRAVPALAALLGDPGVSHSARYALESMPSPTAGRALVDALEKSSGDERLGILGSLGVRREKEAVPALARWLAAAGGPVSDQPPGAGGNLAAVGAAAAAALGEIDHADAIAALERACGASVGSLRDAVVDALLRHANRKLAAGERREARRLFQQIQERETVGHWRMAAFQGVIRASGDDGLPLLITALGGPREEERRAALRLVPDFECAGTTPAFAELLPTLPPTLQVALLNGWVQRRDPPPLATVAPLLSNPAAEVRLAAVHALAHVGDGSVVVPLAEIAATPGALQAAARIALAQMAHREVGRCLLTLLDDPRKEVQIEAARALGERGDRFAVPRLLELARSDADPVRVAALRSLVVLLDETRVDVLVGLVVGAAGETRRAEAVRALTLAFERLQPKQGSAALPPLLHGLAAGASESRAALLSVCGSIVTPEIRGVLRAGLNDPSPEIRAAAVRATSQTADQELLPDLLKLASGAGEEEFRELATKACVRLAAGRGGRLPTAERIAVFRTIASGTLTLVQKRALLAGLADGRTSAELEMAEAHIADAAVRTDAAAAVLGIAPRLAAAPLAISALRRLQSIKDDAELPKKIEAALKGVESRAGFVVSWQSAAPFRVTGRATADLIDAPFPPEANWTDYRAPAPRARLARWEPMAVGIDPKNPMYLRGGSPGLFGVAYAYTWLHSSRSQGARLEIKHDEAVKVWLNGRLVLCGIGGGLLPQAEADHFGVTLAAGRNLLVLKVEQPGKPWTFSVRLQNPDGTPLEDVVADAESEPEPG